MTRFRKHDGELDDLEARLRERRAEAPRALVRTLASRAGDRRLFRPRLRIVLVAALVSAALAASASAGVIGLTLTSTSGVAHVFHAFTIQTSHSKHAKSLSLRAHHKATPKKVRTSLRHGAKIATPAGATHAVSAAAAQYCPAGGKVNVRWHYSAKTPPSGSWSGTVSTSCADGSVAIAGSMEGDLRLAPGSTIAVGYDFTLPGNTQTLLAEVGNPQVVFTLHCVSSATPSQPTLTATMPTQLYTFTGSDWIPSSDQNSPLVYQGLVSVPDVCGGGQVRFDAGGTFSATIVFA
jgi:hypothetical protein